MSAKEFLVTVVALMFGLIAGKFLSQLVRMTGVSISSNDPLIVSLPPTSTAIPSPLNLASTNLADPNLAQTAGALGA